jgi:hypothetical protein
MPRFSRKLGALAAATLAGLAVRADDLPSPDAMWLGQRVVPRALVQGLREGIEEDVLNRVLGTRVAAVDQPPLRARARAAMAPLLDEAFAPELLSGLGAQFLARHYTADELRALRAREESPLGRKLKEFDQAADAIVTDTPAAKDEAREALARRTFSGAERKDLEAFAASPLGRKGQALALDLTGFFVEQLERRYAAIEQELEPKLVNVAEAVLLTTGK